MVSFCGILNNSTLNEINITGNLTGRALLFVFRGEELIYFISFIGQQRKGAIYCNDENETFTARSVKASDKILIYIGSTCSLTDDDNTQCPLQVNINCGQNVTTEFYNGSDMRSSDQKVGSFVKQSVRDLPRVNTLVELNVRVKIRGMCD